MKTFNITVNGTPYSVTVEETNGAVPAAPAAPVAPACACACPCACGSPCRPCAPQRPPLPGAGVCHSAHAGHHSGRESSRRRRCEGRRRAVHSGSHEDGKRNRCPAGRGTVAGVHCNKGDSVNVGDLLVSLN